MSSKTKTTQGVQPKLRFPEFRDTDDWIKTDLHKIANFMEQESIE